MRVVGEIVFLAKNFLPEPYCWKCVHPTRWSAWI